MAGLLNPKSLERHSCFEKWRFVNLVLGNQFEFCWGHFSDRKSSSGNIWRASENSGWTSTVERLFRAWNNAPRADTFWLIPSGNVRGKNKGGTRSLLVTRPPVCMWVYPYIYERHDIMEQRVVQQIPVVGHSIIFCMVVNISCEAMSKVMPRKKHIRIHIPGILQVQRYICTRNEKHTYIRTLNRLALPETTARKTRLWSPRANERVTLSISFTRTCSYVLLDLNNDTTQIESSLKA